MNFQITKNNDDTWAIRPASGTYAGILVAVADRVSVDLATFSGKTMIGKISSMWGAVILHEAVHEDREMRRCIGLNGVFNAARELGSSGPLGRALRLTVDASGYRMRDHSRCNTAAHVAAIGENVYAKGIELHA